MFLNLYKLAVHVLTLPHISACAERIFSKLALLKSKLTNKLKVKTCNSMLSALNLIDKDIEDWIPCDELISKYRNKISKKKYLCRYVKKRKYCAKIKRTELK